MHADSAYITIIQNNRTYYAGLIRSRGELFLTVTHDPGAHRAAVWVPILDSARTEFSLMLIIDNDIMELFIDDDNALTAGSFLNTDGYTLGLSLSGEGAAAENVRVCKLASRQNIFR
jgi:hypothetical protein